MANEKQNNNNQETLKQRQVLEDRKASFLTMLEVVKTKKHFFILTVALTLVGTFLGHFLKVSTYETSSTLFVQNIDQPSAAEYLLNQHVYKLSRVDRIDSYVNHLKSDSFYLKIAEKIKFDKEFETLNLTPPSKKSKLGLQYWRNRLLSVEKENTIAKPKLLIPIENIVGFLKRTVSYKSDFNSQFIGVNVKTLEPRTSQHIANMIVEEFVALTNKHSLDEVKDIEKFVANKKKISEDAVKALDQKLIRFKQKHNIISADATTKSFADRLSSLEGQIETAQIKMNGNNKLLSYFSKTQKKALNTILSDGSKAQGFGNNETSTLIQSKLKQLKMKKSAFIAQGYNENSWQVQNINIEIDSSVKTLKSVLGGTNRFASMDPSKAQGKIEDFEEENRVLKTRISTLKKARSNLQNQVSLMPELQQEYIQIQNQFKFQVENLSSLERKEKELEIQRISHKKEVKVDQLATLPGPAPRGSLFTKLIFSSLAAFFLGLLIVLGLESLDPSVKRRQDLFDCGLDFFGEVPVIDMGNSPIRKSKRFQFGTPDDLICRNNPESIEAMSFKYMRARIESMRYKQSKNTQIITISSALHNEGKSFMAANLATSLSQLKRKVILIDADLRRPSQSAYFGLTGQDGLVDLLNMNKTLDDVLITKDQGNLHIIPAGLCGINSTELISSQKFRLLLEHLKEKYEYIVIDTPPTFAAVDAAIMSSFADIPILVSSFRNTRKADLYEAYNDLLQVSYKKVYGIINKAIVSNSRIHYYGYPLYSDPSAEATAYGASDDEEAQEFLKKLGKKIG